MKGCWIIILAGTLLLGQSPSASDEPISTDRPAVAASSTVVPMGSFQMENGFLISNASARQQTVSVTAAVDGPETAMRYGLTSNTELRFPVPDYYDYESPGSTQRG